MTLSDYINKIICINAIDGQKQLPDDSIDMSITSPPYWGLRNYGDNAKTIWSGDPVCDHEWGKETIINRGHPGEKTTLVGTQTAELSKSACNLGASCQKCNAWQGQLGLEPTIEMYIQHLCDIFDETRRILKDTGSLWVNIGDTFSATRSYQIDGTKQTPNSQPSQGMSAKENGIPDKSLCGIPERFVIEMINRGWIKRNTIIWQKPNAMPSSVDDRFTVDFEYLYLFTKKPHYYFEQQLEALSESSIERNKYSWNSNQRTHSPTEKRGTDHRLPGKLFNPLGRNKRCVWDEKEFGIISLKDKHGNEIAEESVPLSDIGNYLKTWMGHDASLSSVWTINTKPTAEAHFAVFPPELIKTPLKAGCPKEVCNKCGKPREQIIESEPIGMDGDTIEPETVVRERNWGGRVDGFTKVPNEILCSKRTVTGYTDCGCGAGFSAGTVLDMFMGSGTVAVMAKELGMNFIGFDINAEYVNTIAIPRINRIRGMQKTLGAF